MICESQAIIATPKRPSKIHNCLVNAGVKVNPRSQLINKLMVA